MSEMISKSMPEEETQRMSSYLVKELIPAYHSFRRTVIRKGIYRPGDLVNESSEGNKNHRQKRIQRWLKNCEPILSSESVSEIGGLVKVSRRLESIQHGPHLPKEAKDTQEYKELQNKLGQYKKMIETTRGRFSHRQNNQ